MPSRGDCFAQLAHQLHRATLAGLAGVDMVFPTEIVTRYHVNGWNRHSLVLRRLLLFGAAVPALDAVVNAFVGTHQPHYSFLLDYASDMAAPGRPYGEILCAVWAAFPFLFAPFVVAVYVALKRYHLGLIPPALLGLFSVCIGLCGIFRFDPVDPEQTTASLIHVIVSSLASFFLFPGPFFLWLATRKDMSWRRFHLFSLFIQVGGMVGAVLLVLAFLHWITWYGFAERSYWGVYYVWIIGLAFRLRSMVGVALGSTGWPSLGNSAPPAE